MGASGAWAAFNPEDQAQVSVHSSEIAALRHAVGRGWSVVAWPFGLHLHEAIGRAATAAEQAQREAAKK